MKVIPLSTTKANKFVLQYHRHNGKTSMSRGRFAIGAWDDNLGLVGVAIVGNPISATFMDGFTAEVLRTCVRGDAPKNCNSFLYGACWRIWLHYLFIRLLNDKLTSSRNVNINVRYLCMKEEDFCQQKAMATLSPRVYQHMDRHVQVIPYRG